MDVQVVEPKPVYNLVGELVPPDLPEVKTRLQEIHGRLLLRQITEEDVQYVATKYILPVAGLLLTLEAIETMYPDAIWHAFAQICSVVASTGMVVVKTTAETFSTGVASTITERTADVQYVTTIVAKDSIGVIAQLFDLVRQACSIIPNILNYEVLMAMGEMGMVLLQNKIAQITEITLERLLKGESNGAIASTINTMVEQIYGSIEGYAQVLQGQSIDPTAISASDLENKSIQFWLDKVQSIAKQPGVIDPRSYLKELNDSIRSKKQDLQDKIYQIYLIQERQGITFKDFLRQIIFTEKGRAILTPEQRIFLSLLHDDDNLQKVLLINTKIKGPRQAASQQDLSERNPNFFTRSSSLTTDAMSKQERQIRNPKLPEGPFDDSFTKDIEMRVISEGSMLYQILMFRSLFQTLKQTYPTPNELEEIIRQIDDALPDETKDPIIIPNRVSKQENIGIPKSQFYQECQGGFQVIKPDVLQMYYAWITTQLIVNFAAVKTLNQASNFSNSGQMRQENPALEAVSKPGITDTLKGFLGFKGGKKSRRGKKRRKGRLTKKGIKKRRRSKKRR